VAGTGAALVLVAAAFGVPALYVPGLALLLLAGAAWLAVSHPARALSMQRSPATATLEEGATLTVALRVGRGWLPPAGGWVAPRSADERTSLRHAAKMPVRVALRLDRRGRQMVVPADVRVADPLGMIARTLPFPPVEALVLPRVEPVSVDPARGGAGLGGGGRRPTNNAAALEVDGVRPHRPGAPASRIHWPTVARTGTLVERRLTDEAERLPLVVIDANRPADEDALDRALRAAASLCVHLARQGGCTLLLPGERRAHAIAPDLHAWPSLHARLALVDSGESPGAAATNRAGVVLWVSARSGGVPPGLARVPAGERYLVSPFPLAGRRAAFQVAGCTGQRLRAGAEAWAA
jgi:uncharacterized protein (DUF58 family)